MCWCDRDRSKSSASSRSSLKWPTRWMPPIASRIVHRDIKPANISLNERGQVKVLDFGLAKRMPQECSDALGMTAPMQQTQSGQILGTPSFMSPEQALGKDIDHRTDIFSVGVVLYELTTGQRPFKGANFAEILDKIVHAQPTAIARLNYDVPPELERITLKCLQKSPDRRYQSARELLVDLRNLARELEHGPAARSGRPRNRRRRTQEILVSARRSRSRSSSSRPATCSSIMRRLTTSRCTTASPVGCRSCIATWKCAWSSFRAKRSASPACRRMRSRR